MFLSRTRLLFVTAAFLISTSALAADAKGSGHWAFQPVKDFVPPNARNHTWPRNEIDQFILAKIEGKHLQPVASADKRTLIRRATFDLTGLPPTPDDIDSFLADKYSNISRKMW